MASNSSDQPEIIPKAEASRRTGLSVRRLNKAARNGEIPALIIDGEVLLLREPLERMLRGKSVQGGREEDDDM